MMFDQTTISENLIFELINAFKDIAHFKDAKTKQYINCNTYTLKSFGLQDINQVIGHTTQDINDIMFPYWGESYAEQVDNFDNLVKTKMQTINHNEVTITSDGLIRLQNLIKIPVTGSKKTVSGIFTFTQNLTHTLDRNELYQLYKRRYRKNNAISYFLRHLGLDKYFIALPTDAELRILLAAIIQDNYKSIANYLNCSPKTVDMHLSNLRYKIINTDLSKVLASSRRQSTHLISEPQETPHKFNISF
jgi:hypothetical protein